MFINWIHFFSVGIQDQNQMETLSTGFIRSFSPFILSEYSAYFATVEEGQSQESIRSNLKLNKTKVLTLFVYLPC